MNTFKCPECGSTEVDIQFYLVTDQSLFPDINFP